MNHGLKMMVNPMERYQTEGQAAQNALNEAKKLDPENPKLRLWKRKIYISLQNNSAEAKPKELNF